MLLFLLSFLYNITLHFEISPNLFDMTPEFDQMMIRYFDVKHFLMIP